MVRARAVVHDQKVGADVEEIAGALPRTSDGAGVPVPSSVIFMRGAT